MYKGLNLKLISKILGASLLVEAVFLLFPIGAAWFYGESQIHYFIIPLILSTVFGVGGMLAGINAENVIKKRESAIIVVAIWLLYTLIGAMPFYYSGAISNYTDAFFESLSGFTTSGTTVLNNIESLPYNMLFWRSLTHWIGGLGIIVISLALLPMLGVSGYQLFNSESTTPTKEKIHAKISETAKVLLLVYFILTVLCALSLRIAGMGWFDSVNHALSTVSTGGFSTKQNSIAYWNSTPIDYVIIFFMFFSGINFTMFYFLWKMNWARIRRSEELRYYVIITLAAGVIIFYSLIDFSVPFNWHSLEKALRGSLFIVTSIISTTGLSMEDYTLWHSYTWIVLLALMIIGGSAYSTAGGIKVARIVILVKFCYYEFKKIVHPNAILPVRFDERVVKDDLAMRVLAFVIIYCLVIVVGSFILSISGLGLAESVSGMITCLSDVGLGLGKLGPSHSFADIPVFSKWFLAFVMMLGRLELYSVLLLFTPAFWKK